MPEQKYNNLKPSQASDFQLPFKFRLGTAEVPEMNVTSGHPDWQQHSYHVVWAQTLGYVLEYWNSFAVLHTQGVLKARALIFKLLLFFCRKYPNELMMLKKNPWLLQTAWQRQQCAPICFCMLIPITPTSFAWICILTVNGTLLKWLLHTAWPTFKCKLYANICNAIFNADVAKSIKMCRA